MLRFPPRLILVALDFSEPSRRAFRAARLTAARFGARLEAAYCEVPLAPELAVYGSGGRGQARLRSKEELNRRFPGADALHMPKGDPAAVILRLARQLRADLIVMGTNGRTGVARALLGSVAEKVLAGCEVPVLVVRGEVRPIRRVLAPIREDRGARRGLVAAGLVARAFKARLDVLHVVTDPIFGPNPERLLRKRLSQLPPDVARDTSPTTAVRLGDPLKEILRATRGRDLLVLVSRPKSLLGDLVYGTTAGRLARASRIPVLAIPARRR